MVKKQVISMWIDFTSAYSYLAYTNLKKVLNQTKRYDLIIELKSYQMLPDFDSQNSHQVQGFKKLLHDDQKTFENPKLTQMLKSNGLKLEFKNVKPLNTIDAHQLLHLAKTLDPSFDLTNDLARVFFLNYWSKNKNLASESELLKISHGAGIEQKLVKEVFATNDYLKAVFLDEQEGINQDIQGVPFIVFPNQEKLLGTCSVEQLKRIIREIKLIDEN
ncbi:hypothetical protein LD119_00356 [Mesoplasma sp. JKS002660]|uniref:DsbA family oxidoreductase n=1 Tax=Mesoplasma whartonense TaxID=2878854 RepID=UPI002022A49B|nr:DsbA family protein [Mesoplasma sp. JKS002660]MCL8213428.1 hypothetical protein [Mesoplasma sp. JKS002660]